MGDGEEQATIAGEVQGQVRTLPVVTIGAPGVLRSFHQQRVDGKGRLAQAGGGP